MMFIKYKLMNVDGHKVHICNHNIVLFCSKSLDQDFFLLGVCNNSCTLLVPIALKRS